MMTTLRVILFSIFLFGCLAVSARGTKEVFLAGRAQSLAGAEIRFPDSVRIWGFGALHGSVKTEDAELILLEKLLAQRDSVWYFPETDFSTAHYFEAYLRHGNDSLLRQLVTCYGMRVPQERTVEVVEKWRRLRELVQGKNFGVVGIDPICSPMFALQYLLDSVQDGNWIYRKPLQRLFAAPDEVTYEHYSALIDSVISDYNRRPDYYTIRVRDTMSYGYVIRDLRRLGEKRESAMMRNYRELDMRLGLRMRSQFVRMGVGHILRQEQDGWRSFFTRLTAEGLCRKSEICTVQCLLTRSRVVWEEKFDENGSYSGYTTKGGWGISDCWRERFKGIRHLKRNRAGDMTFFDLRGADSPYAQAGCLDLVVCRRLFGRTERCPQGAATLDYLDAAILIRDSRASRPVYELNDK